MWFQKGSIMEVCCVEQDRRLCPLVIITGSIILAEGIDKEFEVVLVVCSIIIAAFTIPTSCCLCSTNPFSSADLKRSRSNLRCYMIFGLLTTSAVIFLTIETFIYIHSDAVIGTIIEIYVYCLLSYTTFLCFSVFTAFRASKVLQERMRNIANWNLSNDRYLESPSDVPKSQDAQKAKV